MSWGVVVIYLMAAAFLEAARYRACASRRACIRSRSFNKDPRGFALSKSEKRTSDADHKRVPQWGGMRDSDVFSGGETQVEKPVTVLTRTFESLDAA